VEERLRIIAAEMAAVKESDLYRLKATVEEAENRGRDLLAEMAVCIGREIAAARARLRELTLRRTST
jgi:hypothetical protein